MPRLGRLVKATQFPRGMRVRVLRNGKTPSVENGALLLIPDSTSIDITQPKRDPMQRVRVGDKPMFGGGKARAFDVRAFDFDHRGINDFKKRKPFPTELTPKDDVIEL